MQDRPVIDVDNGLDDAVDSDGESEHDGSRPVNVDDEVLTDEEPESEGLGSDADITGKQLDLEVRPPSHGSKLSFSMYSSLSPSALSGLKHCNYHVVPNVRYSLTVKTMMTTRLWRVLLLGLVDFHEVRTRQTLSRCPQTQIMRLPEILTWGEATTSLTMMMTWGQVQGRPAIRQRSVNLLRRYVCTALVC